ncbi:COP9 signalosome complex subunit 1-like isoform X1 [Lolium perenne]|uniref:COP9 signalosome complex subunit 1-like isoform X1 n=1 Tax=Lolium perenne TaxID=4522 RepID=UPI0021F61BC8|nr:COP9 signalosome complex subunit 1-like isoform X1 [Lolium perenne]
MLRCGCCDGARLLRRGRLMAMGASDGDGAAAGGGEPSQALLSSDQFDFEVYAGQYSGRTRVARLLFIAGKCESEQMRLDALRLAYEGSLKGEDTALHRDGVPMSAGHNLEAITSDVVCFYKRT